MISDLTVTADAAGFPIVSWIEARGLWAAGGPGLARVECRIMKEAGTGVLLFVARGEKRSGQFEQGKPWQALEGFSVQMAGARHRRPLEAIIREHIAKNGLFSKWLWGDPAQTLFAEFHGDEPITINDAESMQSDLEELHFTLKRAFLMNRDDLTSRLCQEYHRWPAKDDRVATYDPTRIPDPTPAAVSWPAQAAFAAAALALSGFLAYVAGIALGYIPMGTKLIDILRVMAERLGGQ